MIANSIFVPSVGTLLNAGLVFAPALRERAVRFELSASHEALEHVERIERQPGLDSGSGGRDLRPHS